MNRTKYVAGLLITTSIGLGAITPALANDQDGLSNDIIVTARRVEERLQDVPISITVFSQEQIDNRNIVTGSDLATYTPSLTANSRFGTEVASFALRGFTQEQRTTASVGVYFADVVAPRGAGATSSGDGAGPGNLFDLQNAQVLKGPQGTLFGRNTTGGAILLVPKKPTADFEGYLEGSYGNFDMKRLQGVVNAPLSDTFRVRAGFDWQDRDGWLKNYSGRGPQRFADVEYFAARLSIVGNLTPSLENYTVISYSKSTPNGAVPKVTNCRNDMVPLGTLSCGQIAKEQKLGRNFIHSYIEDAHQKSETWQAINTTTWLASDTLTIKNIASYAQLVQDQNIDLFGQNLTLGATLTNPNTGQVIDTSAFAGLALGADSVIGATGRNTGEQQTFTEELQFQGRSANGRLVWQAGGYFEYSSPLSWTGVQSTNRMYCADARQHATFTCTDVFSTLLTPAGALAARTSGSMNRQLARTTYRNIGLYAQGSYDITDSLKFTAGLRYTWDRSKSDYQTVIVAYRTPDAKGQYNIPYFQCINPLLRKPAGNDLVNDCFESNDQNSKAPTWVIGLDYKPHPEVLLYAKWARGYRQGSTNPFSAEGYKSFNAETVDTYEAGAKTSFRGAVSGNFNISLFYNDFRDQQLQITMVDNPRDTVAFPSNVGIVNAGKSRIYGAEVEASISPFQGFVVQGSYAYLNTKLTEFTLPPPSPNYIFAGIPDLVNGETQLPMVPKHKFTIDARYSLPVDESLGEIIVGATYAYTGRYFFQERTGIPAFVALPSHQTIVPNDHDPRYVPAVGLANFDVNWNRVMGGPINAQFFMTNAFNKKHYTERSLSESSGYITRYLGQPRMYGMRLRYSF